MKKLENNERACQFHFSILDDLSEYSFDRMKLDKIQNVGKKWITHMHPLLLNAEFKKDILLFVIFALFKQSRHAGQTGLSWIYDTSTLAFQVLAPRACATRGKRETL